MDDDEEEYYDIREKIFHNTVREYVVSVQIIYLHMVTA